MVRSFWSRLIYSGAEIAAICNEAALMALEETLKNSEQNNEEDPQVKSAHFEHALNVVKPRINPQLLKIYDKFRSTSK